MRCEGVRQRALDLYIGDTRLRRGVLEQANLLWHQNPTNGAQIAALTRNEAIKMEKPRFQFSGLRSMG